MNELVFQTSLSFWISPMFFFFKKKRNKFCDHKIKKNDENENVFKFWTTGISKWLVIIVSSQSVLKNCINHLITPVQAIGHKTLDLETYFSNFLEIRQQKMMSFWNKLIIDNLVCIKTCYCFEPAKYFQWAKQNPKIVIH